ncbi:hypothetical protein FRB99_006367 [Tulasnella sp. 403]|nr:hypothetical protein FRB99_006367 [Tulasnella sp. 403]
MSTSPLLPLTRPAESASLTLTRNAPPSRIRLGRFSPNQMSLSRRYSSPPPPSPTDSEQATTLSGRLRILIKSYGWYALGVYFALSVIDFGVAFALINFMGADRVSHWTAQAKAFITDLIHPSDSNLPVDEGIDKPSKGVGQGGHEGFYAMLVLAYTVHKTLFMPVRVGLTAAFTPGIVNWLASRGWAGRAGTVRAAQHVRERMRSARGKDKSED